MQQRGQEDRHVQDPGDFISRGRPEGREGRRCGGRGAECGDSAEELSDKARRSLDIFSVKKVARLSASKLTEVQEGTSEDDLRCSSCRQFARENGDCQRKRIQDWSNSVFRCKDLFVVSVSERREGGPV